ncbi:unnamed protein product, partial [Sphenostylis stenocarpa]
VDVRGMEVSEDQIGMGFRLDGENPTNSFQMKEKGKYVSICIPNHAASLEYCLSLGLGKGTQICGCMGLRPFDIWARQ